MKWPIFFIFGSAVLAYLEHVYTGYDLTMLYLSGIIISFFLALVLVSKKKKSDADYILLAWLIVLGYHLLTFYFYFTNQHLTYPTLAATGIALPLAHGPFLYIYTYKQTSAQPFKKIQLLHFLPLLFSYLLFARFYALPFDQKVEVFKTGGMGLEKESMVNLYAIYASGIIYVALSLKRLLKYRKNMVNLFSNTEKINFNWLLYLIIWISAIWIVVLFVKDDNMIYGAASLFALWIGYFGIRQEQVFTHSPSHKTSGSKGNGEVSNNTGYPEPEMPSDDEAVNNLKYQKSSLSEEEAEIIHERLKQLMAEQKPFKDPDLTLNELAKKLDIHPNYLSQVINSKENKSFYDLVNEKRVDAFIKNVRQPDSQQYTLLAIAYDCGFNSKASFNRNFKKYTGHTPSDYLKLAPAE